MTNPWYAKGLAFECTRCGHCCTGPSEGKVWVDEEQIRRIANFLAFDDLDDFGRRHLRLVDGELCLLERANRDCTFFHPERGCTVHPVRPTQCRTFPFWLENLESSGAWTGLAVECEGIGRGAVHAREEIDALARETRSMRDAADLGDLLLPAAPGSPPS